MKIRDPISQQSLSSRIWPGWHDRLKALGVRVVDFDPEVCSAGSMSEEVPSIVRHFITDQNRLAAVHLLYLGDVETPEQLAAVVKAIADVPQPPRGSEVGHG